MAKKLADKSTKELLPEDVIKEKGLSKSDFTPSWNGRMYVADPEKSIIAKRTGHETKGEFAIKIR